MSNKNQTSDSSQVGPGLRVKSITPKETGVRVGVPSGKDGQTATVKENRNKRS
jgi:hypothetical protein